MELEETDLVRCADCGEEIQIENRSYMVGPDTVICMDCARKRGGEYDEETDRWSVPPETRDLIEREEAPPEAHEPP